MGKRKYKLTWQKGSNGRQGRWKRVINGKTYYFDGGCGKTDRDAYFRAIDECNDVKAELAKRVKRHADEYLDAIAEWEAVRVWCLRNEDCDRLEIVEDKIKELRKRLAGPRPRPPKLHDRFLSQFEIVVSEELSDKINELLKRPIDSKKLREAILSQPLRPKRTVYKAEPDTFGILPREHNKRLWEDRIESIRREYIPKETTIGGNCDKYLEFHRSRVDASKLSPGRYDNMCRSTRAFADFVGKTRPVDEIDGLLMNQFYLNVEKSVAKGELSSSSGKDRAADADQFIRWLWRSGVISDLPRNLGGHELAPSLQEISVFEISEIASLLVAASERMRLYILLALNAGLTQQDISDLDWSEVNLRSGTIRRKRSKTRKHETTPEVVYTLWPETIKLLRKFSTNGNGCVLLNAHGRPLKAQEIRADGTYRKTDSIGREFSRLRNRCGITGRSFIDLKKTCRTLLGADKRFYPVAELFVGRPPKTISERHYAKAPMQWLAEATTWLRKKLKIEAALSGKQK